MNKDKFEVLNSALSLFDSMLGFKETDYALGIRYGVVLTLRALGLDQEFGEYLKEKAAENPDERTGATGE